MKNKKYSSFKKLIISIPLLLIFFFCTFFIGFFISEQYIVPTNSIQSISTAPTVTEVYAEDINFIEVQGIKNILLISTDSNTQTADSMMILTIDNINKKLKVTSLLTDMLVDIKNHGDERLNKAFTYGEAGKTMETIQNNFGIKIDNYAIIDFTCFKEVVDNIDGVPISVKDYELVELNKNILDLGGSKNDLLPFSGTYILNGTQTLAYSKVCNSGNGEYEKAARQKTMLQSTIDKFKTSSPLTITTLIKELIPYVNTNINPANAINYALTSVKIGNNYSFDIDQFTLPVETLAQSAYFQSKGNVIIIDKEENAKALQNFIFNSNYNYKPTNTNLADIVNKCYSDYGNMDEFTAETYMENLPTEDQYLYDYAKELDIEDFAEDTWE